MPILPAGNNYFRPHYQLGMSLIELLVVLSIISAILYVVAPNFHKGFDSLRMKQLVRNIASELHGTRITAVKTGEQQTWTLDLEKHQYWSSSNQKKTTYSDEVNIVLTTAAQEQLTGQIAAIRFFPAGGSTGAMLELSQDEMRYELSVDWLTGMVTVHD